MPAAKEKLLRIGIRSGSKPLSLQMKTLLDDRFAPITSSVGFLEAPLDSIAKTLVAWRRTHEWFRKQPQLVTADGFDQTFPECLRRLEPLGSHERELLLETRSPWVAYFDSGHRGTDPSAVGFLPTQLRCRGLFVSCIPDTYDEKAKPPGRYGAVQFHLFGPDPNPILNYLRTIDAVHDGDRWVFETSGNAQTFEHPERYQARRVRDRFTAEMLDDYCAALGIRYFDPTFYGSRGFLVEDTRPDRMSKSLAAVQKELGISP